MLRPGKSCLPRREVRQLVQVTASEDKGEIAQLIDALGTGKLTLDELAQQFRLRTWVSGCVNLNWPGVTVRCGSNWSD
jgi:hypothetical protein